MMPNRGFALLIAYCAAALLATATRHETPDLRQCEELGFTGVGRCQDCETLAEYVPDAGLVADCKRCCVKDEDSSTKYTSATLTVCPYRLHGLPHIRDFIDKYASTYKPRLKIVQAVGSYPSLALLNKEANSRHSVRIDQWKVNTLREYLDDKLEVAAGHAS